MEAKTDFSTIQSQLDEFATDAIWYTESELDPVLAAQLAHLSVNQNTAYLKINEVFVTSRLMQREPASVAPLAEVQHQIEKRLLFEANAQAYKKYIQGLREKAFIEILYKP